MIHIIRRPGSACTVFFSYVASKILSQFPNPKSPVPQTPKISKIQNPQNPKSKIPKIPKIQNPNFAHKDLLHNVPKIQNPQNPKSNIPKIQNPKRAVHTNSVSRPRGCRRRKTKTRKREDSTCENRKTRKRENAKTRKRENAKTGKRENAKTRKLSNAPRSILNTNVITALGMCDVCTEAVHSIARSTRTLSRLCVKSL